MIQYLYLGRVGYEEGLRLQAEMGALVAAGRLSNVLLLLEHPAVLTLGRNGKRANVLASDDLLAARGVALHVINRLARQFKWNPQLHQRLNLALSCKDAFSRRGDRIQVPGSNSRQSDSSR